MANPPFDQIAWNSVLHELRNSSMTECMPRRRRTEHLHRQPRHAHRVQLFAKINP